MVKPAVNSGTRSYPNRPLVSYLRSSSSTRPSRVQLVELRNLYVIRQRTEGLDAIGASSAYPLVNRLRRSSFRVVMSISSKATPKMKFIHKYLLNIIILH